MIDQDTILTDAPGLLPNGATDDALPFDAKAKRYIPDMNVNRNSVDGIDASGPTRSLGMSAPNESRTVIQTARPETPEQILWGEVLRETVKDANGETAWSNNPCSSNCRPKHKGKECALLWLASNKAYPGSFIWVCNMMDIDPAWFRRQLGQTA